MRTRLRSPSLRAFCWTGGPRGRAHVVRADGRPCHRMPGPEFFPKAVPVWGNTPQEGVRPPAGSPQVGGHQGPHSPPRTLLEAGGRQSFPAACCRGRPAVPASGRFRSPWTWEVGPGRMGHSVFGSGWWKCFPRVSPCLGSPGHGVQPVAGEPAWRGLAARVCSISTSRWRPRVAAVDIASWEHPQARSSGSKGHSTGLGAGQSGTRGHPGGKRGLGPPARPWPSAGARPALLVTAP